MPLSVLLCCCLDIGGLKLPYLLPPPPSIWSFYWLKVKISLLFCLVSCIIDGLSVRICSGKGGSALPLFMHACPHYLCYTAVKKLQKAWSCKFEPFCQMTSNLSIRSGCSFILRKVTRNWQVLLSSIVQCLGYKIKLSSVLLCFCSLEQASQPALVQNALLVKLSVS